MQKITPFLWFDDQAEEAANFYVSIFSARGGSGAGGSITRIVDVARYGNAGAQASGRPEGSVMTVTFQLEGQEFTALNGGPEFQFTEAISFLVNCENQEEVDELWDKLSEGGEQGPCGWLKDKYGLSWQVVPTTLGEMLNDEDPKKAERVMAAMLQMKKINIQALKQAYEEGVARQRGVLMGDLNFNNVMIGSAQPEVMGEFYTKVLDRPSDMKEEGWYGWHVGAAWLSIAGRSEV